MGCPAGWKADAMKLPLYVHSFIDRHGKPRHYFRRAGFRKIPLPGMPWSPDFMAAYQTALTGQPIPAGSGQVLPGSMRALAVSYYSSPEYLRMSSKSVRRNIIEKFLRETDANGLSNADKRAALLRKEHVVGFMAARADKPDSANGLRKALRALMQHAVTIKLRVDDPTQSVKAIPPKSKTGFGRNGANLASSMRQYPRSICLCVYRTRLIGLCFSAERITQSRRPTQSCRTLSLASSTSTYDMSA
jgi:hypothetical protein